MSHGTQNPAPILDKINIDLPVGDCPPPAVKSWREVRHDIRNQLNIVRLSCFILNRRAHGDPALADLVRDMEAAVDQINNLLSQFAPPAGPAPCAKRSEESHEAHPR